MSKTMRMLATVFVAVVIIMGGLSIMSSKVKAETSADDFVYDEYDDHVIIANYIGAGGEVVIPDQINGKTVTGIAEFAFTDCTGVTSVTIPAGLTNIEKGSFSGCSSLTSIDVDSDNSVYSSQDGVLLDKDKECLIICPEGIEKEDYTIPAGVISISKYAFRGCSNLKSIIIPDSVNSIDAAFAGCTSLTSITIPDGITRIEGGTFSGCISLTNITIPASVTSIGYYAFVECFSLTSIVIPDSVTSIELGAFDYSNELTIYGYAGSAAEQYAKDNNIKFIPLFTDVIGSPLKGATNYQYFFAPVYWAAEQGITKGYDDGTFGAEKECTRAEYMVFLWRLAGKPSSKLNPNTTFSDVNYKKTSAFYKAIAWGVEKDITKGYSDGTFKPNDSITRKDTMIMLYRFAGKPSFKNKKEMKFTDVVGQYKTTSDTYKAICWAYNKGITNGYSSGEYKGQFGVGLNVLRKDIVTFLYRYNNL